MGRPLSDHLAGVGIVNPLLSRRESRTADACAQSPCVKRCGGNATPGTASRLFQVTPGKRGWRAMLLAILFRNKRANRRRARRKTRAKRNPTLLSTYALSCANPFDPSVRGVRVPDDNTYPSVTLAGTARDLAIADANGNVAVSYFPYPNYCTGNTGTISAGGVVSWPAAAGPIGQYSSFNSVTQTFRVVAWGLRVSCSTPITSAGGQLYVCVVPDNPRESGFSQFGRPTTVDTIIQQPWHTIIPVSELCVNPMIVPGRIIDDSTRRYRENSSPIGSVAANDIESTTGHTWIVLVGRDMPVACRLQIEVIIHYEAIPRTGSVLLDAYPSPHIPADQEQGRLVDIGMEIAFEAKKSATQVAMEAMRRASSMLGRSLTQMAIQGASNAFMRSMRRDFANPQSRIVAMSFCEPRSWTRVLSS